MYFLVHQIESKEVIECQVNSLTDVRRLTSIAFNQLNPFPLRIINNKREHHHKILKVQCPLALKQVFFASAFSVDLHSEPEIRFQINVVW
jgi:ABC-type phosphate transport system ATPase subunit